MRLTGYFSQRYDRLLLARRRLTHAARARVDVGLQTGTMNSQEAAACLQSTGVGRERAVSLARNYTLNPGYQPCYTSPTSRTCSDAAPTSLRPGNRLPLVREHGL